MNGGNVPMQVPVEISDCVQTYPRITGIERDATDTIAIEWFLSGSLPFDKTRNTISDAPGKTYASGYTVQSATLIPEAPYIFPPEHGWRLAQRVSGENRIICHSQCRNICRQGRKTIARPGAALPPWPLARYPQRSLSRIPSKKMKERFMLKALGLLLIVLSAEEVLRWLVRLFEGSIGFGLDKDLLLLLIGIGLFYAHPLWHKAARVYVILFGLAIILVAALAFAGFPDMGTWLEYDAALQSIPPPFIALYAAVLLALLVGSYVFLHKAAVADEDAEEVSG